MTTMHQRFNNGRLTKRHKSRSPALQGCPQKRGVVVRLDILAPKKPNSAKRRAAKIRLRNGKYLRAYIPGKGSNLQKLADVLIRGSGAPDLPGVRYRVFRHKLDFQQEELFLRRNRRSKFGLPKLWIFTSEYRIEVEKYIETHGIQL